MTKPHGERTNVEKLEHLSKVLQLSKCVQTRYTLIPTSVLNKTVVAGVRNMSLGANGRNVIRVNNPSSGLSNYNRITIDPKGFPNAKNPHIPVSATTVQAAGALQKGLQVTGKALLVVSILASGYRIGKAIYDDLGIDSEIEAWEGIIDCLKNDLENKYNKKDSEEVPDSVDDRKEELTEEDIIDALEFAQSMLEDARECKKNPGRKTKLAVLCVTGEWIGGAAFGYVGFQTGAYIGALGGPVGSIAGAVVGSVIGAFTGTLFGSYAGEKLNSL